MHNCRFWCHLHYPHLGWGCTVREESKGTEKTAKFSYRTESLTNIYTDEEFAKFVSEIESRLADIKPLLAQFEGFCNFCIVFEELEESPCISLSEETIAKLNRIGASFDIDFI